MTLMADPDQRTSTEDRCDWSDLLRADCAHCHPTRVTTLAQIERAVGHRMDQYAVRPRSAPVRAKSQPWEVGEDDPDVIRCNHTAEGSRTLCKPCTDRLRVLLADLPALLGELDVAAARQVSFVDHGTLRVATPVRHPWEQVVDESRPSNRLPDEYRLAGFARPAVYARDRLTDALRAPDPNAPPTPLKLLVAGWVDHLADGLLQPEMPRWAARLSTAVVRARRVIDCPPDARFIGPCPKCERDLYVAALGDKATAEDRAAQTVQCLCGAPIRVQERLTELLAEYDDKLLTTAELVGSVAGWSGEPITRGRIDWWAKTGRLEAHQRERARYVPMTEHDSPEAEWSGRPGFRLEMDTETAYRVSDVRALAAQVTERRNAS